MDPFELRLGVILLDPQSQIYQELLDGLSEKARIRFHSLSGEQQIKVLLNIPDVSNRIISEIFIDIYPSCIHASIEWKVLKALVIDMQLWRLPLQAHSSRQTSDSVQDLVRQWSTVPTYTPFSQFFIFGCPLSADIDVAVVVDAVTGTIDHSLLRTELSGLGYSDARPVDCNMVRLDASGQIAESSKGDKHETQNMILATYHYHQQRHPIPFTETVITSDIEHRIRAAAKFILDNLKTLIGNAEYQKLRTARIAAYAGYWNRVTFAVRILSMVRSCDHVIQCSDDWKSCFKSLTMKIIQIMLAIQDKREYTKTGLAREYEQLYPGHGDHVLWFLTRGNLGIRGDCCFDSLLDYFRNQALGVTPSSVEMQQHNISIWPNPTGLPDALYADFLASPLTPTSGFVDMFTKLCPDRHISSHFL